jgi:hypothetical protein
VFTVGDGLLAPLAPAALVVGNPPWGAGRRGRVRRGAESASAFVERALDLLVDGGRLCLLVPAAWLEIAAHRRARARLFALAALERVERLGDVFPGVKAPAALIVARREPDGDARAAQQVATGAGVIAQRELVALDRLHPLPTVEDRALLDELDARAQRLHGRATFILGVVTGKNRDALRTDEGEPIVRGSEVSPFVIRPSRKRLAIPLERAQQAAPREAYARTKVVYRFIARHPVAAVDEHGRLTLNSANALAVDDPALDADFVAAVLNSMVARFAHRARATLPRVLRSHLERLPLPAASRAEQSRVAGLVDDALDEAVMDLFALGAPARRRLREAWPRS